MTRHLRPDVRIRFLIVPERQCLRYKDLIRANSVDTEFVTLGPDQKGQYQLRVEAEVLVPRPLKPVDIIVFCRLNGR